MPKVVKKSVPQNSTNLAPKPPPLSYFFSHKYPCFPPTKSQTTLQSQNQEDNGKMDRLPPYDYTSYVFGARVAIITCSLFELLQIFGSLEETSSFSKLFYLIFAGTSAAASGYNIAFGTDGRDEIRKVVGNPDCETRGKSAALVLAPVVSGILLFLCVSGNSLLSFFVLIHVLISVAQIGMEAYETFIVGSSGGTFINPYAKVSNPSCGKPMTSEKMVAASQFTEPLKPKEEKTKTPEVQEPIYHTLVRVQKEAAEKQK
ncbi:hypothetical protein B9Z55_001977 [Caenorhabditis nigoni]|nr:hypothetical protein B9Z55_001977 [Caenorhabditis nigoni]